MLASSRRCCQDDPGDLPSRPPGRKKASRLDEKRIFEVGVRAVQARALMDPAKSNAVAADVAPDVAPDVPGPARYLLI